MPVFCYTTFYGERRVVYDETFQNVSSVYYILQSTRTYILRTFLTFIWLKSLITLDACSFEQNRLFLKSSISPWHFAFSHLSLHGMLKKRSVLIDKSRIGLLCSTGSSIADVANS